MVTKKDNTGGFSAAEKAAMKARAAELRAQKAKAVKADPEGAFRGAIDELPAPERSMARRMDFLVREAAPTARPKMRWFF